MITTLKNFIKEVLFGDIYKYDGDDDDINKYKNIKFSADDKLINHVILGDKYGNKVINGLVSDTQKIIEIDE